MNGVLTDVMATERISSEVMRQPTQGLNLKAESLEGQISGGPWLLVFLRHFG